MIAGLIGCASLTAVDGDTVKCDGQNMRLLGEGVPFVSGIDTPEIGLHAKCITERKLALIAKGRLKELLAEKGLRIVFSGAVDKTQTHRPLVTSIELTGRRSARSSSRRDLRGPGAQRGTMTGVTEAERVEATPGLKWNNSSQLRAHRFNRRLSALA